MLLSEANLRSLAPSPRAAGGRSREQHHERVAPPCSCVCSSRASFQASDEPLLLILFEYEDRSISTIDCSTLDECRRRSYNLRGMNPKNGPGRARSPAQACGTSILQPTWPECLLTSLATSQVSGETAQGEPRLWMTEPAR